MTPAQRYVLSLVYPDNATQSVGIAVFDDPRMDQPGNLNRGLPGNRPSNKTVGFCVSRRRLRAVNLAAHATS